MSSYREGQISQLANSLENAGYTADEVTKLIQNTALHLSVIRGSARIVKAELLEEKIIDTIICVDRSASPAYPDWVEEVLHKDLELFGPGEYDISLVEEWFHPKQNKGVKGKVIYEYLKKKDMVKYHFALADLLAIQARGIVFFRKHFAGKAIFAWKSVVRYSGGNLHVPYLIEHGGKVIVYWYWLEHAWDSGCPALRFASK